MKQRSFILFLSLAGLFLLGGCGGGGGGDGSATHESLVCIGCHEGTNWKTPGSGQPIVEEWKRSTHNTSDGASCQDCHGSGYMHPNSCNKCHSVGIVAENPILNPDAEGMCARCHGRINPRPGVFDGFNLLTYSSVSRKYDLNPTTAFTHFSSSNGSTRIANYVAYNYKNNCRKCHNPHDTSSGREQRKQWAESGHGTTGGANAGSDFKTRGTALPNNINYGNACVRCHTSTGPIRFINSGFSDVTPLPFPAADKSREVTACDVCHDDGSGYAYGYKLRTVSQVTPFYNFSSKLVVLAPPVPQLSHVTISKTFPDISSSNICLLCHTGREIGENIIKANDGDHNVNFANTGFISSHYLTAGASLFQISGYEYPGVDYATQATYPNLHRSIGVANNNGTGTSGPCVTCHLKPARHTFLPVTLINNAVLWQRQVASIESQECGKCHGNNPSGAPGLPALSVSTINDNKNGFFAALEVLKALLGTNGMYYASGQIKTAASGGSNVTNWVKFGAGSGPNTMGAAFNYVLLSFDYGAYAHNPTYAKRLLYDSIDYVHDGVVNNDTCTHLVGNTLAYDYMCKKVIPTGSATLGTPDERP